jgi:hypothetical protein
MKKLLSWRDSITGMFDQTSFTAERGNADKPQGRPEQPG